MNLPFTPDSHTPQRVTPPHTLRTYTLASTKSKNTCSRVAISAQGDFKENQNTQLYLSAQRNECSSCIMSLINMKQTRSPCDSCIEQVMSIGTSQTHSPLVGRLAR